jgi:hypothetical protein
LIRNTFSLTLVFCICCGLVGCSSGTERKQPAKSETRTSTGSEPTADQIDAYLEEQIGAQFDVTNVRFESFIDPTTRTGRVSVKADLVALQPLFRVANEAEIASRFDELNFVYDKFPGGFGQIPPTYLMEARAAKEKTSINVEITAAKVVEGWRFDSMQLDSVSDEALKANTLDSYGQNSIDLNSKTLSQDFRNKTGQYMEVRAPLDPM